MDSYEKHGKDREALRSGEGETAFPGEYLQTVSEIPHRLKEAAAEWKG